MGLDYQQTLDSIQSRLSAIKTTNAAITDSKVLQKKQATDAFAETEKQVIEQLDKLKEQKKRFKRQMKSQLENLLNILQTTSSAGQSSTQYVQSRFVQILNRINPQLNKIIKDTMIGCIGCSQEQKYDATQPVYIKVASVDLVNLLKNFKPDIEEGKTLYESKPTTNGQFPFSMNRELYQRLQNPNVSFAQGNNNQPFFGRSGQNLFDITYVTVDNNGIPGDYFKVNLSNRADNITNVTTFLSDYYSSIKVIDVNAVYAQLMEILSGAISMKAEIGSGEIEVQSKIALIIQRILGLCYDSKEEIDVSGISKIAELDGVDDSFFEFTEIDLRNIDQRITNIKNGVIEFEDCDNVKVPVDFDNIFNVLDKITLVDAENDIKKLDTLGSSLPKVLSNNPSWKLNFPNSFNFELKVNTDFLLNIPKAIVYSLLSPKVLLPLFIMLKAVGQNISDFIKSFVDFVKKFKKCMIKMISKISEIFIKELFNMISKDIKRLLTNLVREISKEKAAKKYIIIAKLVAILAIVAKAIVDWKKCKSVVDEILLLLNVIGFGRGGGIPIPLLSASRFLPGFSETRAFANIVEEFQKVGIPTGPYPDGSPNDFILSKLAELKGKELEETNRKKEIFIPNLSVIPFVGQTLPTKGYGI